MLEQWSIREEISLERQCDILRLLDCPKRSRNAWAADDVRWAEERDMTRNVSITCDNTKGDPI